MAGVATGRRRAVPLFAALPVLLALLCAGCGSNGSGATPPACLATASAYLKALGAAPGSVRLGGKTPISDCLVDNQSGGDLADMSASMVRAATLLSGGARKNPGGAETLRLGYLVGAVQAGAADTSGIHTDLVRRLEASARYAKPRAPGGRSFDRAYARGYAAGRSGG
jgi:hypothetical protein